MDGDTSEERGDTAVYLFSVLVLKGKEINFIWMKKLLLLLVVYFFIGKNCEAQNLVPNPSFEINDSCPNNFSQLHFANNWFSASIGTPDYFNSCFIDTTLTWNGMDVPQNIYGYQNASSGNAYSGIIIFSLGYPNYREYIECKLNTSLNIGTKYYVAFNISLADSSNQASSDLGMMLTVDSVNLNSSNNFSATPQINNPQNNFLTDKSNWTRISGSFIADSAYQYILIGNFKNDQNVDTISIAGGGFINYYFDTYYYIDDVCVSLDSLTCDLNPEGIYNLKETKANINLYPNPANNQLTVESAKAINTIEITDAVGRVQSFKFKVQRPSTQIDINALASGIYFIKVYFGDGSMEVKKFVKE